MEKNHPLYRTWYHIKLRCQNEDDPAFDYYGGRGISLCERWEHFPSFVEDVGSRPAPGMTLDRINPDGDYCPTNIRWATKQEQANNRRFTVVVECAGREAPVSIWAAETGIPSNTIKARLQRLGWTVEQALGFASPPIRRKNAAYKEHLSKGRVCRRMITHDGQTRGLADWAKLTGIDRRTITQRIEKGWSVSAALTTPSRQR